jgi:hypothetical protein
MSIFGKKPDLAAAPDHSSATVRQELELTREATASLSEKLAVARAELTDAQRRYDGGMEAHALGTGREPDRSELHLALARHDALHRIHQQRQTAVATLARELAELELAEAIRTGREMLPAMVARAEACLEQFEQGMSTANRAERGLFTALFDENGLKHAFVSEDLRREAQCARNSIRKRAEAIAQKAGYPLDARFETDGNRNVGMEEKCNYFPYWRHPRTEVR